MPVVGRADDDGVDVLVVEELPVVAVECRPRAAELFRVLRAAVEDALVDVGERHALDAVDLQGRAHVGPAHALAADDTEPQPIARSDGLRCGGGRTAGASPAPIAASDEPWMKRLRDSLMPIATASSP